MRLLHTMLRVGDLDGTIRFWTEHFGMKLLRRSDYPDGKFTLAFVGYGDESDHSVLELTYNWGRSEYALGDAFGHVAITVLPCFIGPGSRVMGTPAARRRSQVA